MVAPANPTLDAPGTGWSKDQKKDSELQKHVAFFDRDRDGIIWPSDTLLALRELGFGYFWTIMGCFLIHLAFSWITWGVFPPDPYMRLKVNRMHKAKHGSDTEIYTGTGQFDPDRFNYVWDMYTEAPHSHITLQEMIRMVHGNLDPVDWFGWLCTSFEWAALFIMLDPPKGRITKRDIEDVYDGSLFWRIALRNKEKKSIDEVYTTRSKPAQ